VGLKPVKRISLLVFLASASAITQSSGTLVGLITEPGGEAVPSARIVLVDLSRGIRRETITDGEGIYAFSLLPPGAYRIEAVKTGFAALQVEPIVMSANQKRSLRLQWIPKGYSPPHLIWHRAKPARGYRWSV
jgi:hypothetical protein